MIKVLHILWSLGFGGIERLVHDLAITQKQHPQLEVEVLFGKNQGDFFEKFQTSNVPCHFAWLSNGHDLSMRKYKAALRIMRGFDVLHFHSFNPLLALAGVRTEKKILYTVHGGFGFGRKRRISDTVIDALKEHFLRTHVNFISFNSCFTRQYAERRYDLEKVDRAVIYNGILFNDKESIKDDVPASLRSALHGKFVVGTTSRFAGFKRIDRLIDAFRKMQHNKEAVLLLVGDGAMRKSLEEAVTAANLKSQVIFTGFQPNVAAYQRLMDVCVFPSQSEPFGLVAIETLSLGKPVLVFRDGGGIVEVVEVIGPEDVVTDVDELTERLAFYYRRPNEAITKTAQRQEYARQFSIERMADSFTPTYRELTGRCNKVQYQIPFEKRML